VVTWTWAVFGLVMICLSLGLTRLMMRVNIADIPNARSSHKDPTPKSGGVAIAVAFLLGLIGLFFVQDNATGVFAMSVGRFALYAALTAMIVFVALADDIWEVLPFSKLLAQLAAAIFFAVYIARIDFVFIPGVGEFDLGFLGYFLTVLWIVFFMNAFNFMHGINGIAAVAALVAGIFLGFISFVVGAYFVTLCSFCIVLSVPGFLVHNFPHGRIFMGDTGSQFIGFVFASLAVFGTSLDDGQLSIYVVPVLFLPFIFDVVITLMYRTLRRQNIMKAHREHLYQVGTKLGFTHSHITLVYGFLFLICGVGAFNIQFASPSGRLTIIAGLLIIFAALSALVYSAGLRKGVVDRLTATRSA